MADYENSNKALDKARLKSKDIPQAEEHQKHCLQKFDKLSESGKRGPCIQLSGTLLWYALHKFLFIFLMENVLSTELTGFKARRVVAFRKNLIEMAELEIKHAKVPLETPVKFLKLSSVALGYIVRQVSYLHSFSINASHTHTRVCVIINLIKPRNTNTS